MIFTKHSKTVSNTSSTDSNTSKFIQSPHFSQCTQLQKANKKRDWDLSWVFCFEGDPTENIRCGHVGKTCPSMKNSRTSRAGERGGGQSGGTSAAS